MGVLVAALVGAVLVVAAAVSVVVAESHSLRPAIRLYMLVAWCSAMPALASIRSYVPVDKHSGVTLYRGCTEAAISDLPLAARCWALHWPGVPGLSAAAAAAQRLCQ